MDPGTAMLVATAVATAAKGASDYFGNTAQKKQQKRRAKELERETNAEIVSQNQDRLAELEAHRLSSRQKLGKRRTNAHHETADLVRGALNI